MEIIPLIASIGLGLIFGSFMNVLIYRLPDDEKSIIKPGSFCPKCNTPVKAYDNIPVISFIILAGKCRNCKTKISLKYPLVELFTAFTFWLCYHYFWADPLYAVMSAAFLFILITLAFIDAELQILPNELTLGGGVVFLIYAFFNPYLQWQNALVAAFGSAALFLALYYFYLYVRKIEAMGWGDIKMVIMLGAFLGIEKLVIAILLASISGMLVGFFFILVKGKDFKYKIPFGTFLSIGSYVSVFWGGDIFNVIKGLYGLN